MSDAIPSHARAVIIGGGIVGCSTAFHLTKLGWKDMGLIEQGRLSCRTTWHSAPALPRPVTKQINARAGTCNRCNDIDATRTRLWSNGTDVNSEARSMGYLGGILLASSSMPFRISISLNAYSCSATSDCVCGSQGVTVVGFP